MHKINKHDIKIKSYCKSHRKQALDLFETSFNGRVLAENYYTWRFENNPFGSSMIELALDSNLLIGHYAVCPTISNLNSRNINSALSMITMTHPNYRGMGIFPALAKNLYNRISKKFNVQLIYGFPNSNSHYSFINKLFWNDIYIIPTMKKSISSADYSDILDLVEIKKADYRFDELWNNYFRVNNFYFANIRNSAFINWRFMDHPNNLYKLLVFGNNKEIGGYAVIKFYINQGKKEMDLVDYLLLKPEYQLKFISSIICYAKKHQCENVNSWAPIGHSMYSVFEKLRFVPSTPLTYFGYKNIGKLKLEKIDNPRLWYYTMGDSDVY